MTRLLLLLALLVGAANSAWAADKTGTSLTSLPEGVELPIRVRVAFRVLNVLRISPRWRGRAVSMSR